ncbi:HAD-IA family hydrolase [Clostridium sp.]|uniref:HAD-IA family hydrolase n=1 Tax=Clostridium sp. TaxID=1506 RepID=UPI00321643EC
MFENIIWDFDGTLFDTYPAMIYAFKMALGDNGVEVSEEEIIKYMKVSVTNAINHFKEIYSLSDEFIEGFLYYEKNIEADKVKPFLFAKEICIDFKKNGGRNFILTHRGNSTLKFLKYYGMLDCFDEIVTKHNCFKRKPDPEGFDYLIKKYNMSNDRVLAVGDRECDVLAGKKSNIKICLYNTNIIELNEKCDYTIESLSELREIIFRKDMII